MRFNWQRVTLQGIIAGLLGYGATALMYAIANVLQGRSPFYTAAALGAALFYGVEDPALIAVTAPYVFAYNGAHLVVFIGLGTLGAWLASLADRGQHLWYVGLFFFLFASFHLIGLVQAVASPIAPLISDVGIWIAGITAGLVMGAYLLKVHPAIRARQAW